ncbi:hypothetical protein Q8F55_004607 [Vanrija albida]|uniref:Uncharacterized protein n=1 Tax=Vanrija albida TaxID=181172 RepID=A0ABR3Q763_9TREE
MPRLSYREHRAQRAAAYGSDAGDSIASFSTLASHTTLGSIASPYGTFVSGQGYVPANSSNNNFAHLRRTQSPNPNHQSFASAIASSGSLSPYPYPQARHRNSSGLMTPSEGVSTPGAGAGAGSGLSGLRPSPRLSPTLSPGPGPSADDKRRRRAKNEERWRRVRAREAAHDAPVRRWAKSAGPKLGPRGSMAVVVAGAFVVRVVLTGIALFLAPAIRARLAHEITAARAACAGGLSPLLKLFTPVCSAALGRDDASAGIALLGGHLLLEGTLLWGAALAWAASAGAREGRTLRTRVAAVVYLILAPVLVLHDGALLRMRTIPFGLVAWALVAAFAGHDSGATAFLTTAAWADPSMAVYLPAFGVYVVGKRIWLGRKGRGYVARLLVAAALAHAALEFALSPAPLRARLGHLAASARSCASTGACLAPLRGLATLQGLLAGLALAPSAYFLLRAAYALRPPPGEQVASATAVPAMIRLLPLTLTLTTAAAALGVSPSDAALPLLPLAMASALRGDDDEWAVAVQAHHVAAIALWPVLARAGGTSLVALAGGYVVAWSHLIGTKADAPSPVLRAHQVITATLARLALVAPLAPLLKMALAPLARSAPIVSPLTPGVLAAAGYAHAAFIAVSLALLIVWANLRIIKTAWTIGAL